MYIAAGCDVHRAESMGASPNVYQIIYWRLESACLWISQKSSRLASISPHLTLTLLQHDVVQAEYKLADTPMVLLSSVPLLVPGCMHIV